MAHASAASPLRNAMGCLHSTHRRPAAYHAQAAPSGRTLTLLTWNTSDGQLSAAAPKHWTWQQQRQGIVDTLVRLQPDVVCLQELQASNPPGRDSIAQMLSPLYTPHGQAFSHRGFCQTFVRQGSGLRVVGPAVTVGPCTLLTLQLADSGDHICVANCHLEPFNTGGEKRARQLQAIVLAAEQMLGEMLGEMLGHMQQQEQQQQQGSGDGSGQQQQQQEGGDVSGQQQGSGDVSGQLHAAQPTALVVAGDTNMRAAEDAAVASLGLRDAWVDTGSSQAIKFTCDMYRNRYFANGFKYTSRYDRVLCKGAGLQPAALHITGNEALGPGHYLSDHFAVLATLVRPSTAN